MTIRSYFGLHVLSPSGKLQLEAISPDNGSEMVRDGNLLKGHALGCFQRHFRYRLTESDTQAIRWERWQERGEGSPVAAVVSDAGHAVIHAYCLDWDSEQLLFVTPEGRSPLVIVVAATGYPVSEPNANVKRRRNGNVKRRRDKPKHATVVWTDDHVQVSTAGPMWAAGAFETFPTTPDGSYFCLRTGWGRRLIVDLRSMTVVEESGLSEDALVLVEREERKQAMDALRSLAPIVQSGDADRSQRRRIEGALAVVITHRISEACPLLRQLELTRSAGPWCSCSVLGEHWYSEHNVIRSLARLALHFIGEEPSPGGNYAFTDGFQGAPRDEAATITAGSVATPSRAWKFAKATPPGSTVQWVLSNLGAPDFIRCASQKVDKYNVWSEVWDYDGPVTTTRLTWSFSETSRREIADQPRQVVRVEELIAWQERDRLPAILGFPGPRS